MRGQRGNGPFPFAGIAVEILCCVFQTFDGGRIVEFQREPDGTFPNFRFVRLTELRKQFRPFIRDPDGRCALKPDQGSLEKGCLNLDPFDLGHGLNELFNPVLFGSEFSHSARDIG